MKKTLFLLSIFSVLTILITRHIVAQENVQQVLDIACIAKDVPSYKDCIQKVQDGKTDFVKITEMLDCQSQDDCAIRLSDIKRTVLIYGATNTGSGFRRVNNYNYALFTLQNSSKISLGSFLIDDGNTTFCPVGTTCPPLILVQNSEKVLIESLITRSAKNTVILVQGSKNTIVRKSNFDNSENHAIEVQNPSTDTTIENNTFRNSWSNAVVFSSLGENFIRGNTFTHNHMTPAYNNCEGFCVGAQLHILSNTKNVTIKKNKILDGSIDTYTAFGMYATGIEISPTNVEKATISCNTIYNNSGNGVVISNRTLSTKQMIMEKNTISNNGLNTNFYLNAVDEIRDNCFDASCKVDGC
jgi:hypothetical protein